MNLEKLFKIQAELDKRIIEKHGLQDEYLLDKKILALQVELGELCQEWRGFKFWSENQEARTYGLKLGKTPRENRYINPLLEEYVDCLHFILSIGNELNTREKVLPYAYNYHPNASTDEIIGQFSLVFKHAWNAFGDYFLLINNFISLGSMLGFSEEQIEQAYLDKNKTNHERQNNGY